MTKKIVHTTQITWDWDQLNSAIKFGFLAIWTLGFASTFTFGELSMEEMFSIYLSNLSNLCKMTTLQSARPNLFLTIGVRCERWPIFVVFAWFSLQWFSPPWPRTIVYHFIQSSRLRLALQLLLLILPIFWRWRNGLVLQDCCERVGSCFIYFMYRMDIMIWWVLFWACFKDADCVSSAGRWA